MFAGPIQLVFAKDQFMVAESVPVDASLDRNGNERGDSVPREEDLEGS